jgi:DNA polymerase-3 subunit delta'
MAAAEKDDDVPHPRETLSLHGHADSELAFLDAYRGTRMPHAWLIGGPRGIGKATLAYRMARFVFAYPDPTAPAVHGAASLALPPDNAAVRRVIARGHSDLLALDRGINPDTGKPRTQIQVEDVRRTVRFFGSTAGEGGWRICIVDAADELNASGANALLKILEEPPARSLLLIVSHTPGRLLPTIRSRCRWLRLRPLAPADAAHAVADALGRDAGESDIKAAALAADGSVARALDLVSGSGLAVREKVNAMLGALPQVNPRDLHALGDALGRGNEGAFGAFVDAVRDWLSARIIVKGAEPGRLARMADAWDRINRAAREVETFNLERKPMVFNVFGWLAEAARG